MEDVPVYGDPKKPADRLRALLEKAGLSQRAAARELGVDERTMRYWCAGTHEPPRMAFYALEFLALRGSLPSVTVHQVADSTVEAKRRSER